MEDRIKILHLSDLHFNRQDSNELAIKIVNDLDEYNPIEHIIVTGDIVDGKAKNKKDAYEIAIKFFNTLIIKLNNKFKSEISSDNFSLLPGNHDLERGNKDLFENYKYFLNVFHGETFVKENYNTEFLTTTRIFHEKKIVILGLNSCMIEPDKADVSWIENSSAINKFINQKNRAGFIEQLTQDKQQEWDDFGKISLEQLDEVFNAVKKNINLREYRVLAAFHHHIYPFPETLSKWGDSSMIRNYYDVLNFFSDNYVQIILHGHKHTPISRPITTNKYFETPESMMYVFSAGSSGDANKSGKSFQVLELHNKKSSYIAKLTKYDYELQQLKKPLTELFIPPKQNKENTTLELLSTLEYSNKSLYDSYCEIAKKTIAHSYQVDSIITNITNAITQFEEVRNKFNRTPEHIYLFLLAVHYRIHKQHYVLEKPNNLSDITQIEEKMKGVINNDLWDSVKDMLSKTKNDEFLSEYKGINDTCQQIDIKEKLSFITVATFFTDIFLTLGVFGGIYFETEGIDHKINITLPKDKSFRSDLELATLKMESDTERRCAKIKFKCSDPTIHKIAVLIIKDFEDKISNKKITLEEAFKNIGLSIYYIRPSIEKKYGLENLNFEAYIPTLLPLLTGENLYKNREVFIREMIQNSMDAILLRTQIEKARESEKQNFDKTIYISFGENADVHNKPRKWVKIRDYGIGMDKFKIERYLTSIGRSFYVSKDFNKLQEKEKISYQPVSNFGIGFLSAFMVCKEISIITKSIESNETLKIEIPNYDGCFFLDEHRDSLFEYGTEITLYQDDAKPNAMDFEKIETYIKETIQDLQLDIRITKSTKKNETIKAFSFRQRNKDIPQLFIPFKENGIELLDYASCKNIIHTDYPYGFTILFEKKIYNDEIIEFNEGIRLSKPFTGNYFYKEGNCCTFIYNFPSSYIQLDVAREKINNFKNCKEKEFLDPIQLKMELNQAIIRQVPDLMKDLMKCKQTKLFTFDVIYRFCNEIDLLKYYELNPYVFCLEFDAISQKISIVRQSDAKLMDENKIYFNSQGVVRRSNSNFTKKIIGKRSKSDSIDRLFDDFLEDFNRRFENFFEDFNYRFDVNFNEYNSEIDDYFEKYFYRFENHVEKLYSKEDFSMDIGLNHEIDLNLLKNKNKRLVFDKMLSLNEKASLKMTFEEFFPNLNIDDRKKTFFTEYYKVI